MIEKGNECLVIGHQGASGDCPQNTLASFQLAIDQGADMIETDLHLTADKKVVLNHDPYLPGVGAIASLSLSQIREFDPGAGEGVCSLEEGLDRFSDRVPFNLELKRGLKGNYLGLEAEVLRAVRQRDILDQVVFSSFEPEVLKILGALEPRARLGLLVDRCSETTLPDAVRLGAESLHPSVVAASPELIERAHDSGITVYVFTVDLYAELEFWVSCGVDGVFTNYPCRLVRVLEHLGGF